MVTKTVRNRRDSANSNAGAKNHPLTAIAGGNLSYGQAATGQLKLRPPPNGGEMRRHLNSKRRNSKKAGSKPC